MQADRATQSSNPSTIYFTPSIHTKAKQQECNKQAYHHIHSSTIYFTLSIHTKAKKQQECKKTSLPPHPQRSRKDIHDAFFLNRWQLPLGMCPLFSILRVQVVSHICDSKHSFQYTWGTGSNPHLTANILFSTVGVLVVTHI